MYPMCYCVRIEKTSDLGIFSSVAVLNDLVLTGQLLGSIHGRTDKAVYIPEIHIKLQNSWVDSFLASNGYLGREVLT